MKVKFAVGAAIIAVAAIAAFNIPVQARQEPAAQGGKTSMDGVYSDAQAKRGEALYGETCASCHGPALGGRR